jgi:hypothetical protein
MLSGPTHTGHSRLGRGTQVVRERSAKPLCVGSIPTRASKIHFPFQPIYPHDRRAPLETNKLTSAA